MCDKTTNPIMLLKPRLFKCETKSEVCGSNYNCNVSLKGKCLKMFYFYATEKAEMLRIKRNKK